MQRHSQDHGLAVPAFTLRKTFQAVYLVNIHFREWYYSQKSIFKSKHI